MPTITTGVAGREEPFSFMPEHQAQNALPHIAQISRAGGKQRIVQSGDRLGAFIDSELPGFEGALPSLYMRLNSFHQFRIIQEFLVCLQRSPPRRRVSYRSSADGVA